MPAELAENLIDFCENRSRVYALLSRCYETEIDAAFPEALAGEAALASDDAGLAAGFAAPPAGLPGRWRSCTASRRWSLPAVRRTFWRSQPSSSEAFPLGGRWPRRAG